jgi:hypothetical protein
MTLCAALLVLIIVPDPMPSRFRRAARAARQTAITILL